MQARKVFLSRKFVLAMLMVFTTIASLISGGLNASAAGSVTVDLTATKQTIRGFGGMNHTTWIPDLTDSQRTAAFGNGAGQIGLSILRIHVDEDSNNWSK